MAKAAVNSQTRTLAIDFKNAGIPVKTIAIAPGFIQTRLTGYRGTVNIKESSNGMYQLIDKLTPEMSGLYYEWTRRQLP
jgi:NAD(P)-dependent dehydrogenase (short-subunit alcohol dehydrogenase family)